MHLADHDGCAYTYQVDDHSYRGTRESCPDGLRIGEPLIVTYLPPSPAISKGTSPTAALLSRTGFALPLPSALVYWTRRRPPGDPNATD